MRVFVAILCFLFFIKPGLYSQQAKFNIRYQGVSSGLTSGNIRKILQDQYGFMWIATQDGLFRYDSKKFISYNTQFTKSQQIGGSDIRNIQLEADSNLIWLSSSYGGMNAIDLVTTRVVRYFPQSAHDILQNNLIKSFFVSPEFIFLGCERGFFRMNRSGKTLDSISLPGLATKFVYVDEISQIGEDRLLVCCRNFGFFIYDPRKNEIIEHTKLVGSSSIDSALTFLSCTISKGNILMVTSRGLTLYKNVGRNIITDSTNTLSKKLLFFQHHFVRRAVFDKSDHLWVATNKGLFITDGNTITQVQSNDERNLNNDWLKAIYAQYVDKDNNLWLGCFNGLAYLRNSPLAFVTYSYSASANTGIGHAYHLFPLNDSIVYCTAEEGLYRINKLRNSIEVIERGKTYDFIFKDPFGRLIVSNAGGLFVLEGKRRVPISSVYPRFKPFAKVKLNSCIKINASCLAMGTESKNGVLIWNFKKNTVEQYSTQSIKGTLRENNVNTIYLLRENEFLVLSDGSMSLFNYSSRTVKVLTLIDPQQNMPFNIFFDVCKLKDTFYIACYGRGIIKLDNNFQLVGEITATKGLSNNGVYKLLPWRDSLLFITTNNGLNVYCSANGSIRRFYKEDGLHDNSFEETSGVVNGDEILAGGANGFTSISPYKIYSNPNPPIFYVANISTQKARKITTDTSNLFLAKHVIPRNTLQTTIYFYSINYPNPDRVTFQYRIAELHKNWLAVTDQNVELVPLPPGDYHLYVRAFNEDNIPGEEKMFIVFFSPEWYQTPLFYFAIGLLIAICVYAFYYIRIRQIRKEHNIRTKLASDLHDDLGSTMNSVKIYAELAIIDRSDKYLSKIKEGTQEAITGIRDIIWVLDSSKDDLESLLVRVNSFAASLCEAHNIDYTQVISDDARYYKLRQNERRNLYMMLKEAVNNSIKYSGAKKIEIKAALKKGKPDIQVIDNGKGFDIQKLSEGNGLKNMQRRTKEIKYELQIQSVPGKGTIIRLYSF